MKSGLLLVGAFLPTKKRNSTGLRQTLKRREKGKNLLLISVFMHNQIDLMGIQRFEATAVH